MHIRSLVLVIVGCLTAATAGAQVPIRSVNPEAVEFDVPNPPDRGVTGYRVELFKADMHPDTDAPLESIKIRADAVRDDGTVRVDLGLGSVDLPDGVYVATIRPMGGERSERSAAGAPFVLARGAALAERVELVQRERRWTRIAIAIGAAILVVPFITR